MAKIFYRNVYGLKKSKNYHFLSNQIESRYIPPLSGLLSLGDVIGMKCLVGPEKKSTFWASKIASQLLFLVQKVIHPTPLFLTKNMPFSMVKIFGGKQYGVYNLKKVLFFPKTRIKPPPKKKCCGGPKSQ